MKNSTMKRLFLCCFLAGMSYCIYGQNKVQFTYDNAGNRITRQKEIVIKSQAISDENNEQPAFEEELAETKITIYPNPTKGILKVDISGVQQFENARMSLYNISGTLLQEWTDITQSNPMDISARSAGVYILQIAYNGNVSSWKIIKE